MGAYILKRSFHCVIVLILLTLVVFFMIRGMTGDPLYTYYDPSVLATFSDAKIAELRSELGLEGNKFVQYVNWLGNILTGDWGTSFYYKVSVFDLIMERLSVSAYIGFLATVIGTALGIVLGIIAAVRRGKWLDTIATTAANLAITIPVFWLGIVLILVFGIYLDLLPVAGYTSPLDDFWLSTQKLIMPVICLMLTGLGSTARLTRTSMLEVIHQDYITAAHAKGLRESYIIVKHALKNALIPVVTVIGFKVQLVLGASIFIEQVFAIPGMGRLMVDATFGQDYVVVQGGVLVIGTIIVVTNLIIDISYGWIDPRMRYH